MKKIATISLTLLVSACASETYLTDVTSESQRETYDTDTISQPLTAKTANESSALKPLVPSSSPSTQQPAVSQSKTAMTQKTQVTRQTVTTPATSKANTVSLTPPTEKQKQQVSRFGYTIQVVAVGSQQKANRFVQQLPQGQQPIWENYKVVNGTKWYAVLYGDYATSTEAKAAINTLPSQFQTLKPFVKSIDGIKNSQFPTLNKVN
ncbi:MULTISPECIES: SPOR domain-containing protein [unclassified Vibrio]|uniref:SPOR domain-containing protein n=1 Tax=Vibrio sp. HB236076 TaxID=3232307 RepID=A0AB39HFJ4_9VIBR|nr:SPOR domain-containing protein [Vibrio sp. HB161653]MDP5252983.1 SPOR domain-containing protein [Vibrio sp. HB161653]